ncbi:MAG: glycosyltransferase family 4 protein [Firmicutes bacterium]|nr:glycosyltransferase family 4 protein [Bacillota bacterium]
MPTINMRSCANLIKGQGVGSCFDEQVRLVSDGLGPGFSVHVNSRVKSDIIHYHTVNPNYYIERIIKKHKTAGIGYVHFLPDTLEESLDLPFIFKKMFYRYLLGFYNSMDYLVTVNPCVIPKLRDYGVTKPKIVYIPNFVSEQKFYPQEPETVATTKVKYGLPLNKFTVMGAGQLQIRKGVLDFVKTAECTPEVQFVWAGGFSFGKITDGYEQIRKIMDNPPPNLQFLGIIPREEMPDVYNMADMFFLPSYDELFPMSILEAMCCKKPILLRDIDIYPDILFDSYAKGKDVEAFSQVIQSMQQSPALVAQWKDKVWKCHLYYSEEHILAMWRQMYAEAYGKLKSEEVLITEGNA